VGIAAQFASEKSHIRTASVVLNYDSTQGSLL
jgi:hypothetical protein